MLSTLAWQCQDNAAVKKYMNFCKDALYYNPGVPSPKNGSVSLEETVAAQDNAAATMYFYALSGMNLDPWLYKEPWLEANTCLTSVWKTVCSTYFPSAEAGCKTGEVTKYLRPCKNVCENYLKACNVQCCDESVQCVFDTSTAKADASATSSTALKFITATDAVLLEKEGIVEGYYDALGPSAMCTGRAAPSADGLGWSVLLLSSSLLALGLW